MENEMPAKQPPPAQPPQFNVSRIAIAIAIILFFIGLFIYISSSPQLNPSSTEFQDTPGKPTDVPSPRAERVEGQIIVKFKEGITDKQINERLRPLSASIKSKIEGINTTIITVPPGQEDAILAELSNDQIVQYVEPDYIYYLDAVPNDPEFKNQWSLMNTGQVINRKTGKADADVDAELAWDVSKGTGVKVAILDSGVDDKHPELTGKIIKKVQFSAGALIDPATAEDKNGHGTHVAGILAANQNDGKGITGVCPECQLMIGKITLDDEDGTVPASGIAPSIVWAADNGAQVINMSIAGPRFSQAIQDAVNHAWGKNAVIVAAAGNNGSSEKFYPAAYANVISVGSTNSQDAKVASSNFGTWVLVAAPGDNILSSLSSTGFTPTASGYGFMGGTSMASPVVSGIAALIWKTQFGTDNRAVVQRLITTADMIPGTGTQFVHGRVNAAKAVGAGSAPSAAPSIAPTAIPPAPTQPVANTTITIIPTFVCGGSMESICPTTPPLNPEDPDEGIVEPTPGTTDPVENVTPTYSEEDPEVIPPQTPGTNPPPGEHKKPSEGGVGKFVALIIGIILLFFKFLFGIFDGGY